MVDKGCVLAALQLPRTGARAVEALRALRYWRQAWLRTYELKAIRPDPTLMLTGLRQIVTKVDAANSDFKLRSSTYLHDERLPFQVDEPKLLHLWEYYLGEMCELAASHGVAPAAASMYAFQNNGKRQRRTDNK